MLWERCRRSPTVPSGVTANRTRVRQPSPSGVPGSSSTATSRSIPAMRRNCSATTCALSRRWASSEACCQSQPPHRPGPAKGHAGHPVRGGLQYFYRLGTEEPPGLLGDPGTDPSPGKAWRTKTTWPSWRPTHHPPWATPSRRTSTWVVSRLMGAHDLSGDRAVRRRGRTRTAASRPL